MKEVFILMKVSWACLQWYQKILWVLFAPVTFLLLVGMAYSNSLKPPTAE